MKKKHNVITNPDELNDSLSYSSPATWVTLGSVIILLIGFFVWSFIYPIQVKVSGRATVSGGNVTLHVQEKDLSKLAVDQEVHVADKVGKISSINDNQPVVSFNTPVALADADYDYYIVIKTMKPIDFWFDSK